MTISLQVLLHEKSLNAYKIDKLKLLVISGSVKLILNGTTLSAKHILTSALDSLSKKIQLLELDLQLKNLPWTELFYQKN